MKKKRPLFKFSMYLSRGLSGMRIELVAENEAEAIKKAKNAVDFNDLKIHNIIEILELFGE